MQLSNGEWSCWPCTFILFSRSIRTTYKTPPYCGLDTVGPVRDCKPPSNTKTLHVETENSELKKIVCYETLDRCVCVCVFSRFPSTSNTAGVCNLSCDATNMLRHVPECTRNRCRNEIDIKQNGCWNQSKVNYELAPCASFHNAITSLLKWCFLSAGCCSLPLSRWYVSTVW